MSEQEGTEVGEFAKLLAEHAEVAATLRAEVARLTAELRKARDESIASDDQWQGWQIRAEKAEAKLERYETALREIAEYRNNDALLRALHTARAALASTTGEPERSGHMHDCEHGFDRTLCYCDTPDACLCVVTEQGEDR